MAEIKKQALLKKGAEASLYVSNWHGKAVVIKSRLTKRYRPKQLDQSIRNYRTIHEPQLMHEAKKAGVPTPTIYQVDVKNARIVMSYIKGKRVKEVLEKLPLKEQLKLCFRIGQLIGRLHDSDIIHGDLTTSNMIQTKGGKIVLIDFGLSEKSIETEAKGVDLHLLKRALQSTHYKIAKICFDKVLEGYQSELGNRQEILRKINEIEKRGRYVAERKQEK